MMYTKPFLLLVAFGLFSCAEKEKEPQQPASEPTPIAEPESQPESEPEPTPVPEPEDTPSAGSDPAGSGALVPNTKRDVRRLSIKAIKKSLEQVTGYEWLVDGESPFTTYSGVLGVPNFSDSTEESMNPSVMFFKALMNAAKVSCAHVVETDPSLPQSERHLLVDVELGEDEAEVLLPAIRTALIRFHGLEEATPDDDPTLQRWLQLWIHIYESPSEDLGLDSTEEQLHQTARAWRLLCEALILSPRFFSY